MMKCQSADLAFPVAGMAASIQGRLIVTAVLVIALVAARPLHADQSSADLPGLFEALLSAEEAPVAARLEGRIWQEWLMAPDEASRILLSRLTIAMQQREAVLALELADELVQTTPDFAEGWNKRATIHYLNGDDDRSVADIRETLALEPRHFGAISGLGLIFLRKGDYEAALQAFEKVLDISPASLNARLSAEQVRRELGREI